MKAGSDTQAVLCCICRFPLPHLTASDLSLHPTDTDYFQHFHLPLSAAQLIRTRDQKVQYEMHLFKLHKAHTLLLDHEADLAAFEQQIDAARLYLQQQVDKDIANAKSKVRALRQAFAIELKAAIKETSEHALDNWTPASDSLSSLIWTFELSNPEVLKIFSLRQETAKICDSLRLTIESKLATFSRFVQAPTTKKESSSKDELKEARLRISQLQSDIARLKQEVLEVRSENSRLKEHMASLQDGQPKPAALPLSQGKSEYFRSGLDLKDKCQYSDSYAALCQAWSLSKSTVPADEETAGIAIALGEVAGLHLGKIPEAEQVVDHLRSILPTHSAEVIRLGNLSAAICYSSGQHSRCAELCTQTLRDFPLKKSEGALYWTALYYSVLAYCELSNQSFAESGLRMYTAVPADNLSRLLESSAKGRLALLKNNLAEAESLLLNAAQLATQHFPTSVFYAYTLLWLGQTYLLRKVEYCDLQAFHQAEKSFATHYPANLHRAETLSWEARALKATGKTEAAIEKADQAHGLYQTNFPTSTNRSTIIEFLANCYRDLGDRKLAIDKRLEAHGLRMANRDQNLSVQQNIIDLASLYEETGELQTAVKWRVEVNNVLQVSHPTNLLLPLNLIALASLYLAIGQRSKAIEKRVEANKAYQAYHTSDANYPQNLIALADLYQENGQKGLAVKMRVAASQIYALHFPSHSNVAPNLAQLAELYLGQNKLQEAEARALQAKAAFTSPCDAAAHNLYCLGSTYAKMGKFAEATEAAEAALRTSQDLSLPQTLASSLLQRLQGIRKRGRAVEGDT